MTAVHALVKDNIVANKINEKILSHRNMRSKKHVSFGPSVLVEPADRDEIIRKIQVGDHTGEKSNTSCDITEVNTTFHITARPQYNETETPGSRVRFCQRLGERGEGLLELQNATDVMCLRTGEFIVTDMLRKKLLVFLEDWAVSREYTADDMLEPWAVTVVEGKMAATCRRSKCVIVLDMATGDVLLSFGQSFFKSPCGIAHLADTNVVVTDDVDNKVSVHDVDSGKVVTFIGEGQSFKTPRYVTVSRTGNIIVSDTGNHSIKIFERNGNFIRNFGRYGNGNGCLKFPHGVCVDTFDNIYVADHFNDRISVFDKDGRFCSHCITSVHDLQHPQGLTFTPDLRLLVTTGDLKATQVLIYGLDVRQT